MSRTVLSCAVAMVVGSLAVNASAAETTGFYAGVGYGVVKLPSEDGDSFSNPKNGSFDFGYSFSESWAVEGHVSSSLTDGTAHISTSEDATFEMRNELMTTQNYTYAQAQQAVQSASIDMALNANASVDTYGLYGVYRTPGAFYAKVKAGVLAVKTSVSVKFSSASVTIVDGNNQTTMMTASQLGLNMGDFNTSESETKTEFSAGVGAGYKFTNNMSAELEYVRLSSDLDYYGLSVKYAF